MIRMLRMCMGATGASRHSLERHLPIFIGSNKTQQITLFKMLISLWIPILYILILLLSSTKGHLVENGLHL